MSNNLAVVNTRLDFTTNMINTLQTGSDDLTLADMNQEGADLLTLQTQQQLGITALSLASQAAQSVLKLF
jgi:flagellin-like hook-associated protein FlgL